MSFLFHCIGGLHGLGREVMGILFRWAEVTVSDQVSYTKDICIETILKLFVNERPLDIE